MKRMIYSTNNEAYNYKECIIQFIPEGWCVYAYPTYEIIAGPFDSWVEAQDWVDEHLE